MATTTPKPPATIEDLAGDVAASIRVLRTALCTFAGAFGYRASTENAVLAKLNAGLDDIERMRLLLLAHQPPDGENT